MSSQASGVHQDAWADWQREQAEVMEWAAGPPRILLEAAVKRGLARERRMVVTTVPRGW